MASGFNSGYNRPFWRHPLFLTILVLLVVGMIANTIYTQISRSGKSAVAIYTLPANTKVRIANRTVSEGTVYVKPGTYTVTATSDGFDDFSKTYTVDPANHQTIVNIILNPVSANAQKYVEEHNQLYTEREGLGSQQSQQQGALIAKKSPITSVLPYNNLLYTIGYRSDPSDPTGQTIIIEIDAQDGYRTAAVQKIFDLGFDPTDYKINFKDYTDPFLQ